MSHLYFQSSIKTSTNYRELKNQKQEFKRPPLKSIENVYYDSDLNYSSSNQYLGTNMTQYKRNSDKPNESRYTFSPGRYSNYKTEYEKPSINIAHLYNSRILFNSNNRTNLENDKNKAAIMLTHSITKYRQSFNDSKTPSSNNNLVSSTTNYYSSTKQNLQKNISSISEKQSEEKIENHDSTFSLNNSMNSNSEIKISSPRKRKPEIFDSILEKYKPDPNFVLDQKRDNVKEINITAFKQLTNASNDSYTDIEIQEINHSKDVNSSSENNQENNFQYENTNDNQLNESANKPIKPTVDHNEPVIISTSENKTINLTEKLAKFRNTISIVRKTEENYGDLLKSDDDSDKDAMTENKDQGDSLSEPSLIFNEQQNSTDQENENKEIE